MEPTTGPRPPGDMPRPAPPPRGPWLAAGPAVVALILWAVVDVLRASVAVGYYEHRIDAAVHGNVDPVLPALMAYELLDSVLPRGTATTVADRLWILASLVAAAAFITWLHRARRNAARLGSSLASTPGWAGRWRASVLVTVLFNGLVRLYQVATSDGGVLEESALDMRIVAYPLWTAETVAAVVTAFLCARVVWRITKAQSAGRCVSPP